MRRVLITISFSFSIRYIVRTGLLQQLRSFCEPVVAITWDQKDLIEELRAQGFEVYIVPEHKREPVYNDARRKLDIWFVLFALKSPTRKIQRIYLDQYVSFGNKLFRKTRELYNKIKLCLPFYKNHLFKKEEKLLHNSTNFNELVNFVDSLNVDAVFAVTPFHKQEDILLRACKFRGKKMITSILSFDNITKRGWIPVEYDLYMVWNKQNKEQLHRIYPFTKNKPVHITGPAQFDFYFKKEFLLPVEEWKKIVGIEAQDNKKIILYAGGPHELFPYEPYYLKEIDDAINSNIVRNKPLVFNKKIILYAGGPHELFPYEPYYLKEIDDAINSNIVRNKPLVLFRCHPMDKIERWKKIVGESENIVFDKSWGGSQSAGSANVTDNDIKKLCSTLAYTDVHINLCSTMTVDGSAFGKPQIGPAYATHKYSNRLIAHLYNQEHFAPIMQTAGLQLAYSSHQLIELINGSLANEKASEEKNKEILKAIISYCDGRSTERVTEAIKNFLSKEDLRLLSPEKREEELGVRS